MMKKLTTYLLAAVSCVFLAGSLAGCSNAGLNSQQNIVIGSNLELTGEGKSFSTASQRGIELAVEEINSQGGLLGKKIKLITMDNHSNPTDAANNVRQFADEHASAIIGPNLTECAMGVTNMADQVKIPVISPAGSYPGITVNPDTQKVYPYMFRATFIDPVQGRAMARFALDTLQARRAAILYNPSSAYAAGLATFFKESFVAAGGTVVAFDFSDPAVSDYETVLSRMKADGIDVLYIPAYHWKALEIIRQARSLGIKVPLLGVDGWDNEGFLDAIGQENLQPIYFTNHYGPDFVDTHSEKFIKRYKEKYQSEPDIYAALGYDSMMMIADAIKRGNTAEAKGVAVELAKTIKYPGATGEITLDDNHDAIKDVFILTCLGGKPLLVEKVSGN